MMIFFCIFTIWENALDDFGRVEATKRIMRVYIREPTNCFPIYGIFCVIRFNDL